MFGNLFFVLSFLLWAFSAYAQDITRIDTAALSVNVVSIDSVNLVDKSTDADKARRTFYRGVLEVHLTLDMSQCDSDSAPLSFDTGRVDGKPYVSKVIISCPSKIDENAFAFGLGKMRMDSKSRTVILPLPMYSDDNVLFQAGGKLQEEYDFEMSLLDEPKSTVIFTFDPQSGAAAKIQ